MDDRKAFAAIVYVLRTGIQWNALPRELGASSTVHDRFQEWERAGFFEELWRAGLAEYDEREGIEWEWQAIDGVMTKAPLGKDATGKNPTDRAKSGTKRWSRHTALGSDRRGQLSRREAAGGDPGGPGGGTSWLGRRRRAAAHVPGRDVRLGATARRTEGERLRASHPSSRQEGEGARRSRASSQWAGQALGSGTDTLVAEPLSTATGALGEESRELPSVHPTRLRPAHLLQDNGFWIRTYPSLPA